MTTTLIATLRTTAQPNQTLERDADAAGRATHDYVEALISDHEAKVLIANTMAANAVEEVHTLHGTCLLHGAYLEHSSC